MQHLLDERARLESEVEAHLGVLREAGIPFKPARGEQGRDLVDSEGFPRSDIDVYAVRVARNRLHRLKTDLDGIAKRLEEAVMESYRNGRGQEQMAMAQNSHRTPIARVNTVASGSPSAAANLKENDLLILFGHIDASTPRPLEELGPFVAQNVNKKIDVIVERDGRLVKLQLCPSTWQGRGLLGCHLLPV